MRVFFFFIAVPTPIFETELELIRNHEKAGDTVCVFQCSGNLEQCNWNIHHLKSRCAECRSRFEKGWQVLNPGGNVELHQFPPFNDLPVATLQQDFNSVNELKLYRYDDEPIGYGVASTLISRYRDHRFDTHVYQHDVSNILKTSVHVYETLKQYFEKFTPDRVYIFNGRVASHLPAVLLCNKMGIDFYTYEVANSMGRYKLWKNATTHNMEMFHKEMEEIWSAGGSDREKIANSWFEKQREGSKEGLMISYIQHQTKGALPDGFAPDKRNIAIFNGTIDEYAGIEGYENSIYSPDETAGIGEILQSFEHDNRYMFYLRVHPHMKGLSRSKNSQLRDIDALASRFRNLRVIWPAEVIDSYALLDACEKVITFGSTLGVEAAYWGKPSILAGGHGIYKKLGCVYVPKNHEELVKLVAQDNLPPLPADLALKYGYWQLSSHTGIPFKYFKQTGRHSGTFDGVVIKADLLPRLWLEIEQYWWRVKNVIKIRWLKVKARIYDKQPD